MQILFIHPSFPGQFIHISKELVSRGHDVHVLKVGEKKGESKVSGIIHHEYNFSRKNSPGINLLTLEFESKMIRAWDCGQKMLSLKSQGLNPGMIIAHPGWGDATFCKKIFPTAKLVHYLEFHYGEGVDSIFDSEFKPSNVDDLWRVWAKNACPLLNYEDMDAAICPTKWQMSTLPNHIKNKVNVVFDGVDTDVIKPNPGAFVSMKKGDKETRFFAGEEILTFVNRNLEPYRGYHSFMRSLPAIMSARPNVKVLIVGGNEVSYGAKPANGKTWKDIFLAEVNEKIDMSRVFFFGKISRSAFTSLLQISRCHVYLTYPFVLSWSAVEALSVGALVVGSNTSPVKEFIKHNKNGLLVDFFNYHEIANTVIDCLAHPEKYDKIRKAARESVVKNYDLKNICLPRQIKVLSQIAKKPL